MSLDLGRLNDEAFAWAWPEDEEVVLELLPMTPARSMRASRASRITMGRDERAVVSETLEFHFEAAKLVIKGIAGVTIGGEPVKPTPSGIEKLVNHGGLPLVVDAIRASIEEYDRRRAEAEGNSGEPPTG